MTATPSARSGRCILLTKGPSFSRVTKRCGKSWSRGDFSDGMTTFLLHGFVRTPKYETRVPACFPPLIRGPPHASHLLLLPRRLPVRDVRWIEWTRKER